MESVFFFALVQFFLAQSDALRRSTRKAGVVSGGLKVRRCGPMVSSEVGAEEQRIPLHQSPHVQNVSASVRRFNRIEVDSVLEDRKQLCCILL